MIDELEKLKAENQVLREALKIVREIPDDSFKCRCYPHSVQCSACLFYNSIDYALTQPITAKLMYRRELELELISAVKRVDWLDHVQGGYVVVDNQADRVFKTFAALDAEDKE